MCYLCPARICLRILKIVIVVDEFLQGTSFKLVVHFPLPSPLFISLAGEQCLLVWGWGFLYPCCSSWIRISPAQWWITLETGELSIIALVLPTATWQLEYGSIMVGQEISILDFCSGGYQETLDLYRCFLGLGNRTIDETEFQYPMKG